MYMVTAVCVSVCLCLSLAAFPHYCTDPDVSWGNGRWCPLVVHYWAVNGFRCYDNIAPNARCRSMPSVTAVEYVCFSVAYRLISHQILYISLLHVIKLRPVSFLINECNR